MAEFGIEEANQLARQRTLSDTVAFISRHARRGPLAATVPQPIISTVPLSAKATAPKPMTQDERDDASARDMRTLAASVGMSGFEQQPATLPSSGGGSGDDDAASLLHLAAAVGLSGFARQESQR